jgi:long-subunit fatty acid transport protein
VLVDFGKMFCDVKDKKLCVPGLKLAFAYREESFYSLELDANAVIPGTINPPGLDLIVFALDAYHPDIITLGLQYPFAADWTVDFSYEKQTWSQLTSQLEAKAGSNAVKDQGNLAFKDIAIPRVAFTYRGFESLAVRDKDKLDLIFGLALEDSALKDGLSPDVNMIDNDRTVYSFGVLYTIGGESSYLNQDMSVEFAYQYHILDDRKFQLSNSTAPTAPFETVNADGEVSVISLGLNVRF